MFFCLNNRATQKKSGVMEIFVGNFYQQGDIEQLKKIEEPF